LALFKIMEVLLLQDIPGVGKKSDLIVVGDGYALNFLLPRRAALVATPLVRKRYADLIRRRAEDRETEKAIKSNAANAISGKTIVIVKKATKTGKLYAGITEAVVLEEMKKQLGIDVKEDDLIMPEHFKTVGSHQVSVQMGEQKVQVTVKIDAESAA
jgi:large subunit ribosomal protein L9